MPTDSAEILLKELKGSISQLQKENEEGEITDGSSGLMALCQITETIFRRGLCWTSSSFGRIKKDYWSWIETLPKFQKCHPHDLESLVVNCIGDIKENTKVKTIQGRGRLFIRYAIAKKFLHSTIKFALKENALIKNTYKTNISVIGNPILSEIFLSLIMVAQTISFSLKLFNSSFLDETWLMPIYKRYEFVPCKSLGITISLKNHRAVVIRVEEGSVGGEEEQIEVGDIFDELYGISFYDKKQRHMNNIMRRYQGLPVYVCIIKCHFQSKTVYPPIIPLIKELKIDIEQLISRFAEKEAAIRNDLNIIEKKEPDLMLSQILNTDKNDKEQDSKITVKGEAVLFHGSFHVGERGRITEIEIGLSAVLKSKKLNKPMKMLVKETEVKLIDPENAEMFFKHSFTEISCCGKRKDLPEYFAYIAGDTTCSISKNFTCYVFQVDSGQKAKLLLNCIVQGFNRTHWAV